MVCRVISLINFSHIDRVENGRIMCLNVYNSEDYELDISDIIAAKVSCNNCPCLKKLIVNDKIYHFWKKDCPKLDTDMFFTNEDVCEFWGFDRV